MNTPELMQALNKLRISLYNNRVFYTHSQQITNMLNGAFPQAQTYFDNNGTYKVQLPDNIADRLRQENGDLVVPYVYDKVNEVVLGLFNLYAHELREACKAIENGEYLYNYIMDGQCPYLGVLYQARFINSVILVEF